MADPLQVFACPAATTKSSLKLRVERGGWKSQFEALHQRQLVSWLASLQVPLLADRPHQAQRLALLIWSVALVLQLVNIAFGIPWNLDPR